MSDNLKYYYIKVKENYYDSDEMILLESLPDGYLYCNILMKLHLRSLRNGGKLMLNEKIPYNESMIASLTRHSVGNIKQALIIFQELGLIEILENGAIYMKDIQTLIGKSSTEGDRKRKYRAQIEAERKFIKSRKNKSSQNVNGQMSDKNPPKIEIELSEDNAYVYDFIENQTLKNMLKDKKIKREEELSLQEQEEIEF